MNQPAIALENGEVLFSSEVYDQVPYAGRWMTAIVAIACAAGVIILYTDGNIERDRSEDKVHHGLHLLKQPKFWYLFWFFFFKLIYYYFLVNFYKIIGLYFLKSEYHISIISTVAFTVTCVFRIIIGRLFDKYDWTSLSALFIVLEMLLCLTMPLIVENLYLYGIWLTLSLAISGASYMSVWILTERLYKNASWVITYVAFAMILDMLAINGFHRFVISVFCI
jgi:hypothetical protein